jgi:hypothetical protein
MAVLQNDQVLQKTSAVLPNESVDVPFSHEVVPISVQICLSPIKDQQKTEHPQTTHAFFFGASSF